MEEKREGEVPEAEDRVSRRNWCLKQQGEGTERSGKEGKSPFLCEAGGHPPLRSKGNWRRGLEVWEGLMLSRGKMNRTNMGCGGALGPLQTDYLAFITSQLDLEQGFPSIAKQLKSRKRG